MAFTPHTLVAFGGKLTNNTSPDQWQCGVRLAILDPDGISWRAGLSDPQVYLNALHAPLLTWFQRALVTTAGSEFATLRADAYLDWVKVNNIDALGRYADPTTTHRWDYNGTSGGGGSVNIIPPFVTAAVSLTTALARGRGHRGRIYLPFSIPLSTTGYLTAATQAGCNGTVKALLNVLKAPTYTLSCDRASRGSTRASLATADTPTGITVPGQCCQRMTTASPFRPTGSGPSGPPARSTSSLPTPRISPDSHGDCCGPRSTMIRGSWEWCASGTAAWTAWKWPATT
jgi:hypothetical protein